MNRGLIVFIAVIAMASLLANAWLAANVAVLSQQVDQLQADVDDGFPVATSGRTPSITFENPAALAAYTVQTHDSLAALESALERDMHRSPSVAASLELTHRAIDGRDMTVTEASPAGAPFLTYSEE